jgi:putative FmdB family regulatory protein
MPIHEFQCESCNYVFELLLMSQSEFENVRCPKCQSPDVGKLMSASNINMGGKVKTSKSDGAIVKKTSAGSFVEHRQCQSGSCSTLNLAGHER